MSDAGVAHRPVPRRARREIPMPKQAPPARPATSRSRAPRSTTCANVDVKVPLGAVHCVTGVSGLGQVHARQRGAATRRWPTGCTGPSSAPAPTSAISGLDQVDKIINIDQSPIGRTPRSNPATYIGLFDHIRDLFSRRRRRARAATSRAASRSTSRAGAARSAAATARSRSRCTSCPTSTCRASSATASATTARRSRCASRARRSPTCSTMTGRGGARLLPAHPEDQAPAAGAARRGARLHPPRPAGHHALGRRGAAREAGHRAGEGGHRPHALHPRRAHHRPALRRRRSGCSRCSTAWSTRATPSW